MKIWANTIVNNEENFIWFALMSTVDYVDKILVWDSGSTDKTVEIIKTVAKNKGNKIEFKEVGAVDEFQFTKARQDMLDQSDCDWILILDGDEVWWEESLVKILDVIKNKGDQLDAIVVPFYNMVGDVYHYQDESAGDYELLGRKGHLTIRAFNKKSNLHWSNPYGSEGLLDKNNKSIQDIKHGRVVFVGAPFMHLTHLRRTNQDREKFKYDYGIKVPKDFKYPEVFLKVKPDWISSPWTKRSPFYEFISIIKTPFSKLRRDLKNK